MLGVLPAHSSARVLCACNRRRVCERQMEATAWLGHWYREVAENHAKARNCYKKVLAADPNNTVIGARPRQCDQLHAWNVGET